MENRTYSVEQANQALPEVSRVVERIVDILPAIPELQETVRIKEMKNHRAGKTAESQEELAQSVAELRSAEMALTVALRRLEELDITLKDPGKGLVDFPCFIDGELVELCWQLGEKRVSNWHRVGEGYSGRKPLKES